MRETKLIIEQLKHRMVWLGLEKLEYQNESIADYFDKIFILSISRMLEFVFIPNFTIQSLAKAQPIKSYSEIQNSNDARIHSALEYPFVITPNNTKQNIVEKSPQGTLIYFVSEEEFTVFSREFFEDYFAQEFEGTLQGLLKYQFMQMVIHIVASNEFPESEFQRLLAGTK